MNGLMSPTRRARSGSITNRNATATVPARPKPATKPFCPSLVSSSARTSPGSPRIGAPSTKSEATSSWESAPSTWLSAYKTGPAKIR